MIDHTVFHNVKDFDLTHIFECGQCFRWVPFSGSMPGEDRESNTLRYIGAAGGNAAVITQEGSTVTIDSAGGSEDFWRSYFDLDSDYGAIKTELAENEPRIKAAADYGYGIRILRQDPFETLISFIISQNNNIPRIRKNIGSLCERYGERIEGSEELLSLYGCADESVMYAFPTPKALAAADESELAAMKLGYRCAYIKASAAEYLKCGCPSCREELLAFHGIGPKVANCIMLFGLRDTAAFPVDTWVKQIMNDMYGFDMSDTKGMQAFAHDRFGSLAGYAQQYLFYYYRDRKS